MTRSRDNADHYSGLGASNPTVTLGSNATFPAGHVIQTTSTMYNSNVSDISARSTTLTKAALSGTNHWAGQITGVLASSWVFVIMTCVANVYKADSADGSGELGIIRTAGGSDTTLMAGGGNGMYDWNSNYSSGYTNFYNQVTITYVDKSAGTGTNDYYLGINSDGGSSVRVMSSSTYPPFICTLQEIAQ
jgi:hypothetical protein